ncbi:MAG: YtxH domain-containing protein [Ignavibacteriales bacterium]|nr:YtxH domain-containing protein [Ignavibacteriales bacterium]
MLKNMLTNKGNRFIVLSLVVSAALLLASCDKAKDTMEETKKTVEETTDKAAEMTKEAAEKMGEATEKVVDTVKTAVEKTAEEVKNAVDEKQFVGVWQGKLDSRLAILTITSQDGNDFSGKITISYRTPINQEVKGTYNPETKSVTMADQLHSRVKGKYAGKLSADGKTYSGTFTTLVDKNSATFNLVKK